MPFTEKTLVACRDCGRPYTFTVEEQESFAQQGFRHEPSRCADCRAARKARTPSTPGGSFGSGYAARNGAFRREPAAMYPAVCSRCGKNTEVPFQPRGDRPVFCRDCYAQEPRRSYDRAGSR